VGRTAPPATGRSQLRGTSGGHPPTRRRWLRSRARTGRRYGLRPAPRWRRRRAPPSRAARAWRRPRVDPARRARGCRTEGPDSRGRCPARSGWPRSRRRTGHRRPRAPRGRPPRGRRVRQGPSSSWSPAVRERAGSPGVVGGGAPAETADLAGAVATELMWPSGRVWRPPATMPAASVLEPRARRSRRRRRRSATRRRTAVRPAGREPLATSPAVCPRSAGRRVWRSGRSE
jgi:hypothetical protein